MTALSRFGVALGLALGIAVLVGPAFAQQQPIPGKAPTTPTNPTTPTTPTTPTIPGRTPSPSNPTPDQQNTTPWESQQTNRPIFLSGKVMLDSGGPPPDSVVIQRVCNGNPRSEAYTDSKGRFSFQLGENNGMMQDASMGSSGGGLGSSRPRSGFGQNPGLSERDLMGCEIRAVLAGYRSDMAPLSGRRYMDNPDIGTLILHRIGNVEGVSVSASSLKAPKDAKKAYEKGGDLLKKKKIAEARKEIERSLEIYPGYAAAWYDLGRIKESLNDLDGARDAYGKSVEADTKYVNPYRQLAQIYFKQQKWQETADTTSKLLKLDPVDFPEVHYYNAISNYYLRNFDAAEKSIRDLQKLDTENRMTKSSKVLGAILIEKQDYAGAAVELKRYLSFLPAGQVDEAAKKQLAELEQTAGVAPQAAPSQ